MAADEKEEARLRALRELNLLDTAPSENFDRITRLAAQFFETPISAVSLTDVDRQWFKSRVGCGPQIPREHAPCAEVTRSGDVLVVSDLAEDPRFNKGVLVENGVRFYAGAPLVTKEGFTLGSMCVLDTVPREIGKDDEKALRDLAAMVMTQIELQHAIGRIDPVSGLPNRQQFTENLEDLARDFAGERRLAILLDLAPPNQIVQALRVLGPTYLDDLMRLSVEGVRNLKIEGHTVYHVGGAQLLAVIGDADEERVEVELVKRLNMLADFSRGRGAASLSHMACGIAPFILGEVKAGDVLRAAHHAAQDARESDRVVGIYSAATDEEHKRRYALIAALRELLERGGDGELSLVYQPRIDLKTGRCYGAEALLRWDHPEYGSVSPAEFIPLAEQTDLMRPLTSWVKLRAIAQLRAWRDEGYDLRVSINVSAANLEEEEFGLRLASVLAENGVSPSCLEIEFTESTFISNRRRVVKNLTDIRELGVVCAIDDFGTGYSTFSYLHDFPADIIKIDQTFIRKLEPGSRGSILVQSLIHMAGALGYRVVAEGVETQDVADFLIEAGCHEGQGYLFSRPLPPEAFADWLKSHAAERLEGYAA
ncbi:GGDEF and EAL domain-containing protein [Afifella sp. JA880]|uniref:putative bifunctional diguanylate cyclase/phosphodiesterase n=1 Tax=Afifella sp. JA880 TaxID=2975280 RepID=UPI0021BA512A|nr:GGDEF and EAL domain-containing protein [Afifella sp. JA880]MCT8267237.1 GGDEF and EAL domain-containing protein [Afifella sp. JA880]